MIGVYQIPGVDAKIVARNYYDGSLHVSYERGEAFGPAEKVKVEGNTLQFLLPEPINAEVSLHVTGDSFTGTVNGTAVNGTIRSITDGDDRIEKCTMKKRALIMYATITKNTERIAKAFGESFEDYGWQVDYHRISNKTARVDFDYNQYDIVCLGSPIVAGSPLVCVQKRFSPGGGSSLEEDVTKNAEAGLGFNAGGVGLRGPEGEIGMSLDGPGPGGPGGPGPVGFGGMSAAGETRWAGCPPVHGVHQTLGIIFTTYGGGCTGPDEAMGTLALLKLYLEQGNVKVIGTFACCGKEFGPAGIDDGGRPMTMGPGHLDPPVYYKDGKGNYHAGSFFFHTHMNAKPSIRDITKAKMLIADIVEDYFYSHDGLRKPVSSQYTSIS